MAKNQQNKINEKEDVPLDTATTALDEKSSETEETPTTSENEAKETKQNDIVPKAIFVRLRDTHPQDSYGRAGYRFNKTDEIEIPMSDLTEAQVLELNDDPWLECHFVV